MVRRLRASVRFPPGPRGPLVRLPSRGLCLRELLRGGYAVRIWRRPRAVRCPRPSPHSPIRRATLNLSCGRGWVKSLTLSPGWPTLGEFRQSVQGTRQERGCRNGQVLASSDTARDDGQPQPPGDRYRRTRLARGALCLSPFTDTNPKLELGRRYLLTKGKVVGCG